MQLKNIVSSAVLAGVAVAQAPTTNFTQQQLSQILMNATGHQVSATILDNWCTGQHTACSNLCGSTNQNQCDPSTLTWNCLCASNNSSPGLGYYTTTLPNLICNALNGDCMADNANDLTAQQACNKTYVCVNNNITQFGAGASSSASASSSPTGSSSSSTASSAPSPSSSSSAALAIGEHFGFGLLSAAALAIMGLVL